MSKFMKVLVLVLLTLAILPGSTLPAHADPTPCMVGCYGNP